MSFVFGMLEHTPKQEILSLGVGLIKRALNALGLPCLLFAYAGHMRDICAPSIGSARANRSEDCRPRNAQRVGGDSQFALFEVIARSFIGSIAHLQHRCHLHFACGPSFAVDGARRQVELQQVDIKFEDASAQHVCIEGRLEWLGRIGKTIVFMW